MDELLPKLAIVGQKVNTFTGTDYSGIEALRREIKEQEQLVKSRRLAVKDAKERLDAAHAQQASSQKEVVGLLERKHSWLAADLERYMSLIRSEHVNDQAVQAAKDAVQAADASLEEARARLEKRERAQYHEEQIWSDTIRRNSTWVTIGLMGFNTFLLLVSLAIFEPWRRRRIVREIKGALDEKTTAAALAPAAVAPPTPEIPAPQIEAEIDTVVEPAGVTLERIEDTTPEEEQLTAQAPKDSADVSLEPSLVRPAVAGVVQETPDLPLPEQPVPEVILGEAFPTQPTPSSWSDTWESYKIHFRDLFSERHVTVRKVDLTTVALEGVAAGAAFVGLVVVLLRPK
ncbi:sensitivity to high expression protein she9 [Coniosporium apollinis]|uniref:Sensitive to high expression protein 9, mitochondrial n=1 Tax=Coniosporium apollinis TaxID=61459 RepID=A0ABQ9P7J3_9PEZI|nr:sensitivity to high expression protein she9 [Coniosporium apollinis]